jgi:hypothetical protein
VGDQSCQGEEEGGGCSRHGHGLELDLERLAKVRMNLFVGEVYAVR